MRLLINSNFPGGKLSMTITKAIFKLKIEHLVSEVDHDEDGWWVYLTQRGWSEGMDCRTIHEDTVKGILDQLRSVVQLTDEQMAERR